MIQYGKPNGLQNRVFEATVTPFALPPPIPAVPNLFQGCGSFEAVAPRDAEGVFLICEVAKKATPGGGGTPDTVRERLG
jgi:hypothetical protein